MSELIIIAGPQAAGKTTVVSQICSDFSGLYSVCNSSVRKIPPIFPLQESRQIVVHKNVLLGAIFMTREQEEEVVECDLARMDLISNRSRDRLVYLDECNIFTIAHAMAHGIVDVESHWQEYILRLKRLNAKIIFLDVDPEISWERRRRKYQQRLIYFPANRHNAIMRKYHEYLIRLHPLLLDVYHRLPFPKEFLDARKAEKNVMQDITTALMKLSNSLKPTTRKRGSLCKA